MASTHSKQICLRILLCFLCDWAAAGALPAQDSLAPVEKEAQTTPAKKAAEETTAPVEDQKVDAVPPKSDMKPETAETTTPALTPEELAAKERAEAEAKKAEAEARKSAAEAARIAEAKRIEAERTWFDKLLADSKLYTGLNAGLVIPMNSLHGAGYGFGMTIDYVAYQRYAFHFGAETGLMPAKAGNLQAGATSIRISDQGTMGYLNLRFAGLYVFPKIFDLETAAGAGVSVYRLNSGTYSFNTAIAPMIMGTAYYNLLASLQVGLIAQVVLPSVSRLESPSVEYTLDSSQSLATASLHASVRYMWF